MTNPKSPSVLWILWAALSMSVVTYTAVATFVRPQVGGDIDLLTKVFAGVALVQAVASFALRPMLARMDVTVYFIVRWALMESIAVLGLVLAFMGAQPMITYYFSGVSLLLLGLAAPTADQIERYEESRRMTPP